MKTEGRMRRLAGLPGRNMAGGKQTSVSSSGTPGQCEANVEKGGKEMVKKGIEATGGKK